MSLQSRDYQYGMKDVCKLNDSINVIKEMIDVRDEFKECQGFSRDEVEGFIEMLCIDWLFLTSLF